jgi:hypothetical protein
MPLRSPVTDLQELHYAQKVTTGKTSSGETITVPGDPVEFTAVVSVPTGQIVAAQYGPKLPYVRALSGYSTRLREGWYVWLDAPITGKPDYTVIADRSTLRQYCCDIGKRGAFGG